MFAGTQEAQSKKDGGKCERDTDRELEGENLERTEKEKGEVKSERGPDHKLPQ